MPAGWQGRGLLFHPTQKALKNKGIGRARASDAYLANTAEAV